MSPGAIEAFDRPGGPVLERALDRASGSRAIPDNAIRHLTDGPETFAALRTMIAGARECIHFENYIIRGDATGRAFADDLQAAAGRGVAVRVLYDWVGSVGTSASFWRRLRAGGVDVRAFNPVRLLHPDDWWSRDHRKYVSVDNATAVLGGLCIGDEWAGDASRGRRPWRDTAVEISGPAVQALEAGFARTWAGAGPPLPPGEGTPSTRPRAGNALVRVVEGIPGRHRVYRTVQLLAAGAAERLWLTEAYLLPPQALYASLAAAARDGVDVRLLLPSRSDVPVVSPFTRVGYRELLAAGVRIWEWRGAMLHAKTAIVDGAWFKVGSSNLNATSLTANYELDVLIHDRSIVHEAMDQFRHDLARSSEVVLRAPRWARGPLATRVAPAAVAAAAPEVRDHVPTAGERSQRAFLLLRQVAAGARRSIAGATVFGLLGLGILLLALPRFMAYFFAAGAFWLAGSAAWHYRAWQHEDE